MKFLIIKTDLISENNESQQCRTCLSFGFPSHSVTKPEIDAFFPDYVKIDITKDNIPKTLCVNCLKQIETINDFVSKCRNSSDYLIQHRISEVEEILIKQEEEEEEEEGDIDSKEESEKCKIPKCTICEMTFTRTSSLKRHLFVKHTSEKETINQCYLCGKQTMTEEGLRRHFRMVHNENKVKNSSSLKCPHCPKEFSLEPYLVRHMRRHKAEKRFLCTMCGAKFLYMYNLKIHSQSHQMDKPFECNECSQTFARNVYLKRHYRVKHLGVKPYQCSICGRSFAFKDTLIGHERSHTGEKPFLCNKCGLTFTTRNTFNRHKRNRHLKDDDILCEPNQLECHLCLRKFAFTTTLKRHILNCHKCTEKTTLTKRKRPTFLCTYCGKVFIKEFYNVHINTHLGIKPYKCKFCDKAFTYKSYMRLHLFTHSGQRPFKCDLCDKSFLTKANLNGHVNKIHLKQMPFSCNYCDKKYAYRTALLRHTKTIHWNIKVKRKEKMVKI